MVCLLVWLLIPSKRLSCSAAVLSYCFGNDFDIGNYFTIIKSAASIRNLFRT